MRLGRGGAGSPARRPARGGADAAFCQGRGENGDLSWCGAGGEGWWCNAGGESVWRTKTGELFYVVITQGYKSHLMVDLCGGKKIKKSFPLRVTVPDFKLSVVFYGLVTFRCYTTNFLI
jgi:hypothetical protein